MNDATHPVMLHRYAGPRGAQGQDAVAREEPLEIRLAGAPLAVVMRTPGADRELALGFLATERVVARIDQVASVRHCTETAQPAEENVLQVVLAADVAVDLERLRRNLYASSSCGICGKATIENALVDARPLEDSARFAPEFFYGLPSRLEANQAAFARTGGLHAAALFDAGGELLVVREDIGRHNAVDKVIGWAIDHGRFPLSGAVLLVSGRVSYEIVQKALVARIPVVAAVSAPSSLAVEFAEEARLTLVAFLRGRSLNVYGATERVGPGVAARPGHSS
ncbi:MAG: formate dehydrogenase accessory sulfurtransferase FdhD [Myxococcota bacterium]|nr:formate dehydrogenase accessory sulfurtransferase FdhD [Myxococcota bacterium]